MAQLLRGCAYAGPFAAAAAPDDDEDVPFAEDLNRQTHSLLQVRHGCCVVALASCCARANNVCNHTTPAWCRILLTICPRRWLLRVTNLDMHALQTDLDPAEQLRMVMFVAAADTIHHHIGATRCRGDTAQCLNGVDGGGVFGSWTSVQSRCAGACCFAARHIAARCKDCTGTNCSGEVHSQRAFWLVCMQVWRCLCSVG